MDYLPADILREIWGYPAFRPMQEDIINAVLEGHDVLALLPTGGGKSICFQVPALAMEGMCLVVSPLIALMKDQVAQLKRRGVAAAAIYAGMSLREVDITLDNCVHDKVKFLYVSPERLQTNLFQERMTRFNVSLVAIDEAHCISEWGFDFRPQYRQLSTLREALPKVPFIALTATATPPVRDDITQQLNFRPGHKVFVQSFARPNLSYAVRFAAAKDEKLAATLQRVPGTAIVYAGSRRNTQQLAQWLQHKGLNATWYHAGLSTEQRNQRQDDWLSGRTRIMVATNAFGMGIDKPNVRLVVHMYLPASLEAYYQEAGRAGRDGQKAYALIIHDEKDLKDLVERTAQAWPETAFIKRVYQALANYFKVAVGSSPSTSHDFDLYSLAREYELPTRQTFYAIKKLEENGLLQLSDGFNHPSKLYVPVSNRALYDFQIANEPLEPLIKALLRLYGGELFSGFVQISEQELAVLLSTSQDQVKKQLHYLNTVEVAVYDAQPQNTRLTFLTERYDLKRLPLDTGLMDKRRQIHTNKARKVHQYVGNSQECRTNQIIQYFGQEPEEPCGVCDVCVAQKKQKEGGKLQAQQPTDRQYRQQLLQALEKGPMPLSTLIENVKPADQKAFMEVLKGLVDSGAVYYDGQDQLRLA